MYMYTEECGLSSQADINFGEALTVCHLKPSNYKVCQLARNSGGWRSVWQKLGDMVWPSVEAAAIMEMPSSQESGGLGRGRTGS